MRGFGLGCICLGIKDSGGSRHGLGGLHCSVHFVSIFKSSLRRLSLRGTFRGFDTAKKREEKGKAGKGGSPLFFQSSDLEKFFEPVRKSF